VRPEPDDEGLRGLLAHAAPFERTPPRDLVPLAIKRLRLRHHAVTNVNEVFGGLAALARAVASLFSVAGEDDDRHA
jgi:hypothetical protein